MLCTRKACVYNIAEFCAGLHIKVCKKGVQPDCTTLLSLHAELIAMKIGYTVFVLKLSVNCASSSEFSTG